ncbi:hypothetical protein BN3087_220031 [Sulfurovum sp. enrichment culture clone C5]|uniref:Uncharacterized protein n=1 Tax=Sulfurovum sp. enrichment culture clone C5 TaxID=497650 RepID=A0A0S4XMD4_9BACT|nr:hypothetical protein BN3087_220031 [Sulfurovum sp. enrichment culture clone C5]
MELIEALHLKGINDDKRKSNTKSKRETWNTINRDSGCD